MANVRFKEELETRLQNLAQLTGRSKSFYIRQLVEDNIDQLEDRYLAEQRLENPTKRLSSEQVRRELALDN